MSKVSPRFEQNYSNHKNGQRSDYISNLESIGSKGSYRIGIVIDISHTGPLLGRYQQMHYYTNVYYYN